MLTWLSTYQKKSLVDCCRCKHKTNTWRWSKSNSTNRFKWKFRSRTKYNDVFHSLKYENMLFGIFTRNCKSFVKDFIDLIKYLYKMNQHSVNQPWSNLQLAKLNSAPKRWSWSNVEVISKYDLDWWSWFFDVNYSELANIKLEIENSQIFLNHL